MSSEKRWQIVPIRKWLEDPYYLGPEVRGLRPYWKERIIEYFESGKRDYIFTGSMRTGKSYASVIIAIRYIYEISCYYEFPVLFGLSPTTIPKIIFFSYSKSKASSTGLKRILRIVDKIPYFQQKEVKRRDLESAFVAPYLEVWAGSTAMHAIGEDVIGAMIDESNARNTAAGGELKEAQDLFMEIKMRSATTFSLDGKSFGFSGIISSADKPTSFTEVEIKNAMKYDNGFVVQAAVYDVNPAGYSKERFTAFVGNGDIEPFIVDEVTEHTVYKINQTYGKPLEVFLKEEESNTVHVPESLRNFYQRDIGNALKNLSGIAQAGSSKFIKNPELLNKVFCDTLKSPLTLELPEIGIYDAMEAYDFIDANRMLESYDGSKVYSHFDISKRNDKTGIGFFFLDEEENKIKSLMHSHMYHNREIEGNEIDQTKVYGITYFLYELGVNFGYVSADKYASDFYLQRCKLLLGKERAGHLSVDAVPCDPYLTFLFLAKKGMLQLYPYKPLKKELLDLEVDRVTGMVDHPKNTDPKNPRFGKDVADAVVGSIYNLYIREDMSMDEIAAQAAHSSKTDLGESFYDEAQIEGDDFYSGLIEEDPDSFPDKELPGRYKYSARSSSDIDFLKYERELSR